MPTPSVKRPASVGADSSSQSSGRTESVGGGGYIFKPVGGGSMDEFDNREKELWAQVSMCEGEEKVHALMELGHDAFHEGKHIESLALTETACQIYESMGAEANSTSLGHVYRSIGWCLKELKRYPEAAAAAHGQCRRRRAPKRRRGPIPLRETRAAPHAPARQR